MERLCVVEPSLIDNIKEKNQLGFFDFDLVSLDLMVQNVDGAAVTSKIL